MNTSFGESSYAVGISVSGSHICDQDIKYENLFKLDIYIHKFILII